MSKRQASVSLFVTRLVRVLKWRQAARRRALQRGMAVGELLVLTVPLCVMCMAIASKLSATSSVRVESQWRTALAAQQATTQPSGDTDWTMTAPIGVALADAKVRKATEPLLVSLLPNSQPLPFVAKKTIEQSIDVRDYFYRAAAEHAVGDDIKQVTTSATFVCNEPNNGDDRRGLLGYEGILIGLGEWQAFTLFGNGGSKSNPTSDLDLDLCKKSGDGSGKSPCDVIGGGK